MPGENEGASPAVEAHASDNVPVEVRSPEPLVVAKPAPEPAPETVADEPVAGGETDPAAPAGKPPKLPDWAQKRLNAAEAEKRITDRENKRLADELAAFKAPKPAETPVAAEDAPEPKVIAPADFDAAVSAEADRRTAADRQRQSQADFDAKCNTAYTKGKEAFKDDFDTAINNLRSVGAMQQDVLDLVLETDDPAKVLYELGSDPDQAAALVSMTPAKRAIEVARLALPVAPKKGEPVKLSNAPRPITPVDGSARVTATPSDNDDDDTFFRKRAAELEASGRW